MNEPIRQTDDDSEKLLRTAVMDTSQSIPAGQLPIEQDLIQANAALEASHAQLQAVLDGSTEVAIIAADTNGLITVFNAGAERMLGYTAEEMVGKLTPAVFHLESEVVAQGQTLSAECGRPIQGFDVFVERARRGGHEAREWTYVRKDGRHVTVNLVVTALHDPGGNLIGFLGVATDVTERKRVEEENRRLIGDLQLLLESAGEGIYGIDVKGRFTFINQAATRTLGFEPQELLGRNGHDTIHHTRKDGSPYPVQECPIYNAFRTGQSCRLDDEVLWRKDGTSFPAEYASYPILRQGAVTGAVVTFSDITERQRAEAALRARNEELKEFAYTVSHDLKAPLRGIVGYAQELERRHKEGLSERAQFCIAQILIAGRNLDRLIEDLLRYSRLDAESPTLADVDVPALVQAILKDRSLTLAQQGVEVSVAMAFTMARAWGRGLHQVLTNLIDNAVKYSRQATPPRLTIRGEELPGSWRLSIADNGIGFDMKYHDRIFGLFNRLSQAAEFEGTGAGLAIVKKLLTKQGGTIRAESAPGQGATFFVELPKPAAPPA